VDEILKIFQEIMNKSQADFLSKNFQIENISFKDWKRVGIIDYLMTSGSYNSSSKKIYLNRRMILGYKDMSESKKAQLVSTFIHELSHFFSKHINYFEVGGKSVYSSVGFLQESWLNKVPLFSTEVENDFRLDLDEKSHTILYRSMNEAMTVMLEDKINSELYKRTGKFRPRTRKLQLKKWNEKEIPKEPYTVFKLILKEIILRISIYAEVPVNVVENAFIKGYFDNDVFFTDYILYMFGQIFGKDFLKDFSDLTVSLLPFKYINFGRKYKIKNLF
jgi:hypothetical protein